MALCCSFRGAKWRDCAPPHVFAWGNQLAEALLVGEGVGRAAGACPAYSPQVLFLRSLFLPGLLETTNLRKYIMEKCKYTTRVLNIKSPQCIKQRPKSNLERTKYLLPKYTLYCQKEGLIWCHFTLLSYNSLNYLGRLSTRFSDVYGNLWPFFQMHICKVRHWCLRRKLGSQSPL